MGVTRWTLGVFLGELVYRRRVFGGVGGGRDFSGDFSPNIASGRMFLSSQQSNKELTH